MDTQAAESPSNEQQPDPVLFALYQEVMKLPETMSIPSRIFHVPLAGSIDPASSDETKAVSTREWKLRYAELQAAALAPLQLVSPEELERRAVARHQQKVVPIALALLRYSSASAVFASYSAAAKSGREFQVPAAEQFRKLVEEKTDFFACAYLRDCRDFYRQLPLVHFGRQVRFVVTHEFLVSNVDEPLRKVEVDFGDGGGYRAVELEQEIAIAYPLPGPRELKVRARFGERSLESTFELVVEDPQAPAHDEYWDLTADKPWEGISATGHAWVFRAKGHAELVEPVIISEGFPGNYCLDYLWAILNQHGLARAILDSGRDLIILGYTDGTIYLQANAEVAIACVRRAIQKRQGNAKLIVGGASMGGLVTRYALTRLEYLKDSAMSQISTFVTIDSPHLGANVPMGVLAVLDAFSNLPPVRTSKALVDSVASKQMLLNWYDSQSGKWEQPNVKRKEFVDDLAKIGNFPRTVRTLALADGAGNGMENGTQPARRAVEWSVVGASFSIATVPGIAYAETQNWICRAINPVRFKAVRMYDVPIHTPAFDSAPGGTNSFFGDVLKDVKVGFSQLTYSDCCFIPTASALCMSELAPLDSNARLFYNLNENTPPSEFSGIYWGRENDGHVVVSISAGRWLAEALGVIKEFLGWQGSTYDRKAWIPSAALSSRNLLVSVHEGPSEHALHYRVGVVMPDQTIKWDPHSHQYDPGGNRPAIAINSVDAFVEVHKTSSKGDWGLYYYRGTLDARDPLRLNFPRSSQRLTDQNGVWLQGTETRVAIRDDIVIMVYVTPDRRELCYVLGQLAADQEKVHWLTSETFFRRVEPFVHIGAPSVAITRDFDAVIAFEAQTLGKGTSERQLRYQVGRIVRPAESPPAARLSWITPESRRYDDVGLTPSIAVNEFGKLVAVHVYSSNREDNLQYRVGTIYNGVVTLPEHSISFNLLRGPRGQYPTVTLNNLDQVATVCERNDPDRDGQALAFIGAWSSKLAPT